MEFLGQQVQKERLHPQMVRLDEKTRLMMEDMYNTMFGPLFDGS